LCRGDNGKPIPVYRLPGTHEDREAIYFWQRTYHEYNGIWLGCGELEIPVYKQLADPSSELSQKGREICRAVEKAIRIPTYYFLMRYWGRRSGEDERLCPGCGRAWLSRYPTDHPRGWWQFAFQCHNCRLVSQVADCDEDERHAVIGEYTKQRKENDCLRPWALWPSLKLDLEQLQPRPGGRALLGPTIGGGAGRAVESSAGFMSGSLRQLHLW